MTEDEIRKLVAEILNLINECCTATNKDPEMTAIAAALDALMKVALKGAGATPSPSLAIPFSLRPDFIAQLVLPRDLDVDEADRLCKCLHSFVMPQNREDF